MEHPAHWSLEDKVNKTATIQYKPEDKVRWTWVMDRIQPQLVQDVEKNETRTAV